MGSLAVCVSAVDGSTLVIGAHTGKVRFAPAV